MRKINLNTKVFLDGADPIESKNAKEVLGFLDGQTTNPTLLVKNPEVKKRMVDGRKFSEKELYSFYENIIGEIGTVADGPISVEVYADKETVADDMIEQACHMLNWTNDVYIKLPITKEGLKAAQALSAEGVGVNMTLCFSQAQAAAVYSATKGSKKPVFVSPFIGRLDDKGGNGLDLIENILRMFKSGDGHVLVLGASVRSLDHLFKLIDLSCPIATLPYAVIERWNEHNLMVPGADFKYIPMDLKPIAFDEISLDNKWEEYDIFHELTDTGLARFSSDWKEVIA